MSAERQQSTEGTERQLSKKGKEVILGMDASRGGDAGIPKGYKWTEVGVIPEDWFFQTLREDVALLSGHHVLAQHCNTRGDGVPYLTGPADFPEGRVEQTKFTNRPSTICQAGDILVTVKGSGSGTIVEADASYCISRQLMAIRVKSWNSKFLLYSILQNASRIKSASTGLIPGLSRSDILDQEIPLPNNSAEQRTIAEALSDVDGLIEALEALITKKRAIKQAAMQQLLTGKTRLPGFSGAWETKRMAEDVTLLSGQHVMAGHCNTRGDGAPYLTGPADFPDGRIQQTKFTVKPTTLCRIGDILVTVKGSGSGTLVVADGEYCISRQLMAIRTSCWNATYLFYSLLQNASRIAAASTGLIPGLSRADILEQELPLPSEVAEQTAIATALSEMDAEIAALERRRDKTRAIKQGMMQQLLTGRIRLVEPKAKEAPR